MVKQTQIVVGDFDGERINSLPSALALDQHYLLSRELPFNTSSVRKTRLSPGEVYGGSAGDSRDALHRHWLGFRGLFLGQPPN